MEIYCQGEMSNEKQQTNQVLSPGLLANKTLCMADDDTSLGYRHVLCGSVPVARRALPRGELQEDARAWVVVVSSSCVVVVVVIRVE